VPRRASTIKVIIDSQASPVSFAFLKDKDKLAAQSFVQFVISSASHSNIESESIELFVQVGSMTGSPSAKSNRAAAFVEQFLIKQESPIARATIGGHQNASTSNESIVETGVENHKGLTYIPIEKKKLKSPDF
jgi:hypothetical protein